VALSRIHAALKPGANFYLRDIVSSPRPTASSATSINGRFQHQNTISTATAW